MYLYITQLILYESVGIHLSTIQNIVIGIGVLIGILLFNKTNPTSIKAILIGLIISIGLPFISSNILIIDITFWIFGILTLIFLSYNLLNKNWLNFIVVFFAFASFLFGLMNWQYYNGLLISMIIPVICYFVILKNWESNINLLSILSILGLYELALFLGEIGQLLN